MTTILYAHCPDDGGFTFGMDARTPVTFEFSNRPRTKGIYRSFFIKKPSGRQVEYARSNPCVVTTVNQLRAELLALA